MATVVLIDGFAYTGFLRMTKIAQNLSGGATFLQLPYDNSQGNNLANVTAGVNTLDTYLNNIVNSIPINGVFYTLPITVLAISMGAQLAYKWIRDKSTVSTANVSFVLLGNPENKFTGVCMSTTTFGVGYGGLGIPNTCPYTVTNFVRQYDGVGDYPNLVHPGQLALNNAWLGMAAIHNNYFYVGLNDSTNYSFIEGPTSNLKYTWGRTYPCPIDGGMQDIWSFFNVAIDPTVAASIQGNDTRDRPIIERSYNRPVRIPIPQFELAFGAKSFGVAVQAARRQHMPTRHMLPRMGRV